jgi:ferredoxin
MAHRTVKTGYAQLVDRLNKLPQGAPPSDLLNRILAILMDEREAGLIAQLPIRPFTAVRAARAWKVPEAEARRTLEKLAGRALLVDVEREGEMVYVLPPPMAGFFEFSLMRTRGDLDQKALGELFYQYLNVEEDFIKALFTVGETQLGRTFVQEPVLSSEQAAHVLDYERASEVIRTASHIGVGMCYCRHKMQHMDRACDAPMDICLTFNSSAESLTRHGHARAVDRAECLDLLDQAYEHGLVQFGENVQQRVNFICNCCGCCCEALIAQRKFAHLHPVHTTNFLPVIDDDSCNGCGKCVDACPVEALSLTSANDPHRPRRKAARLDPDVCLGCGVCVRSCPQQSIGMKRRAARVITPVTNAQRYVLMAIERDKLQNLIFDNQVLASHRALAALLGSILKLPPVKRALAGEQLKSRFLAAVDRLDGSS